MALPNPLEAFVWGAGGGRKTPEQIARERAIAAALGKSDYSPVGHWSQGLGRVADALYSGYTDAKADKAEAANASESQSRIAALLGGTGGQRASEFPPAPDGDAMASGGASAAVSPSDPNVGSTIDFARGERGNGGNPYRDAIASIESDGSGGYSAVGPTHKTLGRALGRYQVMEANIGPWSKAALGREVTPDEFLANPAIQDTIFDHRFGGYVKQFGNPQDAASAWFTGQPLAQGANRRDVLGTTGTAYVDKFNTALGGQPVASPAPIQVASLDPSAGVAQATQPVPDEYAATGLTPEAWQAMNAPDGQPAPAPAPVAQAPAPEPQQQVAQALLPVTAGGTADAIQPGQTPPNAGMNPAIMEALTSPYASDQERAIAGILLKQQMELQAQANDPMRKLQIEKGQLEIDALKNPRLSPSEAAQLDLERQKFGVSQTDTAADNAREAAKFKFEQEKFARESGLNREKFDWEKDKDRLPEFYDAYVKQEMAAGREPLGILDYVTTSKKAGATSITTNVGEGDKFYENLDKKNAETFAALSEEGVRGNAKLGQIDRLEGLLAAAPQGAAAMLKQAAGEYGINTEGLSDIQAAQALINELVPQQRQPGSGPMSDADLALFKQSLPRLINQPGGNQTIINTMRGITQYQIQMGQIADAVADRDMSPKEAREAIRALPNPLAAFGKPKQDEAVPEGVDPEDWKFMDEGSRRLFQ